MDWITGIQKAIDYTEEHLEDVIDFEKVAEEACSSSFQFQRIFTALCGISLGEYIRNRRLSKAAEILANSDAKVIDVAFRFCYETPESFTRAFTRFHGITPKEAKRGGRVKSFSKLSVKLVLTGGSSMDYRIEKLDAFKVLCKRTNVKKPMGMENDAVKEISDFWAECGKNGTTEKIISYFPNNKIKGLLGISFSSELNGNKFPYGIGVEYDGGKLKMQILKLLKFLLTLLRFLLAKKKCQKPLTRFIKKSCRSFSLKAQNMNTAGVLNWKFIRHRIFQTQTIPAKSGFR